MVKEIIEPLRLRPFNLDKVRDNSVCVFIGKTHTGKSVCVKDLLYNKADFPVGKVMSGTENANGFYKDFVPKKLIDNDWSPIKCDKFVKRQEIITNKKKEDPNYNFCDPRGFFILDDLMYDISWINYITIKRLFLTGRHYNILFIITMQYPLGIPPALRTNIDFVFLFRENIIKNRRRLYENFAGMFPTFECFCATMDKYTEDYGCLVVCNGASSNKILDQVFYFKASLRGDFRTCDKVLWDMQEKETQQYKPTNMFSNY